MQLSDSRRRELLKDALSEGISDDPNLTDDQYDERVGGRYDEVMEVCGGLPDLHMDVKFKGKELFFFSVVYALAPVCLCF